jgi:hypothetical protein
MVKASAVLNAAPKAHPIRAAERRQTIATGASPWKSCVWAAKQTVPTGLRPWLNSVAAPRLDLRYSAIPAFTTRRLTRGVGISYCWLLVWM